MKMDNQGKKEEHLLNELETMYQKVAESEEPDPDRKQKEELEGYYEILQVLPDSPLSEIKESYERLVNYWHPDRFTDNPSFREKAEKKLTDITGAYEKILACRETEQPSVEPTREISMDTAPPFLEEDEIEEEGQDAPPLYRRVLFLAPLGAAFAVLILGIIVWPTHYNPLYQHDQIRSGSKTYNIRTNRITGSLAYFDGGKWNNSPIPIGRPPASRPATATPPAQRPLSPAGVEQPGPQAKSVEKPMIAVKKEGPSEIKIPQPPQPPVMPPRAASEPAAKPGLAEKPMIVAKKEAPSAQPPAVATQKPQPEPAAKPGPAEKPMIVAKKETLTKPAPAEKGARASRKETPVGLEAATPAKPYGIQIAAIRSLEKANSLVNELRREGAPVYLSKVKGKNTVWYRVCIGHFKDRAEADRYMKEKKIREMFPHSIIQKIS